MKSSHTDPKTSGCPVDAIENSHSWRNPSFPSSPVFSQALLGINLGFQLPELLAGGEGEPAPAPQRRFSWLACCCQIRAFLLVLRGWFRFRVQLSSCWEGICLYRKQFQLLFITRGAQIPSSEAFGVLMFSIA